MNNEDIYNALIDIADRIGIEVKEKNLKTAGINVKSGLCKIKGKYLFIMDKHKKTKEKIGILSSYMANADLENIYIMPAIRRLFEKYEKSDYR
ncbi:MAG: hypothetical protein JRJ49_09490 [Deltaproteobacteria bacterium]|nr:hypothetical protein [Deltaproteobacteria bacterium]